MGITLIFPHSILKICASPLDLLAQAEGDQRGSFRSVDFLNRLVNYCIQTETEGTAEEPFETVCTRSSITSNHVFINPFRFLALFLIKSIKLCRHLSSPIFRFARSQLAFTSSPTKKSSCEWRSIPEFSLYLHSLQIQNILLELQPVMLFLHL